MMQKRIYICITLLFILILGCTEDDRGDIVLNNSNLPSNLSLLTSFVPDNSGTVIITPLGSNVATFTIDFGDGSEVAEAITPGEKVEHIFAEGDYELTLTAQNLSGGKSDFKSQLTVSLDPPENLIVIIENDQSVSKQVNVTATADLASNYRVYFGENNEEDFVTAVIGETVSYTYTNPGTYTIRVTAIGASIQTTSVSQEFEVTEILQPVIAAPEPPSRNTGDVISLFTEKYENLSDTNFFPDWGQGGQGSSWASFDLNGDEMLQYINLSYQGIQLSSAIDVSQMEFLHLEVWSASDLTLETSLISLTNGEKPAYNNIVANTWTSIDIPISVFTDQGLTVADIHQLKFVGDPWAEATVFIDNIYFYKGEEASIPAAPDPTEPAGDVISMFSDTYTNVGVDTWITNWSSATLTDLELDGNATKRYDNLDFVGIETVSSGQIDASDMTHFHTDVYSENFTEFKIKLVDFGPNGTYDGPGMGDDTEHEITYTDLATNEWVSLDIPLSDFTGLTSRANISQLIYVGVPSGSVTVYIDNVYFHK